MASQPVYSLTIGHGILSGIPDYTANRMMMAHGSSALLRAIRGEPEPIEPPVLPAPRHRLTYHQRPRHIRKSERPRDPTPTPIKAILQAVADAFRITVDDLTGNCRAKYLIHARAVACRLIRDRVDDDGLPRNSLPRIAMFMDRDHSTISNALGKFDLYCRYPEVAAIYAKLRELRL
jgi:hypothetical protein